MYEFTLILLLLQQMCVFLVIAWLMSKTRLFIPLMQVTVRLPHKLLCYITFSIFCIMGTYFGLHIEDSIANTRAIGAVMGGLLGGPVVGGLVGLTGGLHRYSLGGMTALSCMVSTIAEGLLGGLMHSILIKRGRSDKVFSPLTAGGITFVAELVQMAIILLIARPFQDALHLVQNIAAPMMVTNTIGAAMFMRILLDKRAVNRTEQPVARLVQFYRADHPLIFAPERDHQRGSQLAVRVQRAAVRDFVTVGIHHLPAVDGAPGTGGRDRFARQVMIVPGAGKRQ